ncbi:hypothetical protein C8A00DRAFT_28981 [Chaetomidium leptoderma]|uniref:Uncharacterized protein n=1 Tax=Chaetomidium leptoderma TaxID=669021 RepID=A0AAN6VUJ8_9PEZI|nr:hypothetical protein C8A00DRAFT_28981 [Chaetomidium leptoderma]
MQKRPGRTPSGHLSRLRPVELDPLAEYGLPSKGEKRLLSPKVQESYYAKIVERYLAFCTEAGDRDSLEKQFARSVTITPTTTPLLPPTTSPSPSQTTPPLPTTERLPQILSALRKLREALVATRRHDHFSIQVYLFSIRLGILASSYETYYPSLLHLLRNNNNQPQAVHTTTTTTAHPASSGSNDSNPTTTTTTTTTTATLTNVELNEVTSYLILDAACRRGNLTEAYALRNRYYRHRHQHQHQHQHRQGSSGSSGNGDDATKAAVDAVLRALAGDNWVVWRRVKKQVDGYRARLMEAAEGRVTAHTLKAFGRAYLSVGVGVLEEQTGRGWAELKAGFGVGWELEGGRVVIRRVRGGLGGGGQ